MANPTQPKPNPVPAILVYGTPSGPALTQASWFRAEDKEAVKAAAEALKFSVIELQTDADRALAAGAHEGVLKGSGRMIVGSVSAEVYRRIEEHVRKAAGAPDASRPDERRSGDDQTRVRTKHEHQARRVRPRRHRRFQVSAAPAIGKPDSATARETLRSARGSWPPTGTRSGSSRASGSPSSSGSTATSSLSSGSTPRNTRRSRAGPRTSPSSIPSSASRASDARKSVLAKLHGAACGSPLFIPRMPMNQARAIPTPNLKRLKP